MQHNFFYEYDQSTNEYKRFHVDETRDCYVVKDKSNEKKLIVKFNQQTGHMECFDENKLDLDITRSEWCNVLSDDPAWFP